MKITNESGTALGELWSGLGGDPDMPEGAEPVPDCCDTLPDPIDRALEENGAYAVMLGNEVITSDDLNFLHGTDSNGGGTQNFSNPTNANDGNPGTKAIRGLFAAGAGTYTCSLVADLGSAFAVTDHVFTGSSYTAHSDTITIQSSPDGVTWTTRYTGAFFVGSPTVSHASVTFRYWKVIFTTTLSGLGSVGQNQVNTWSIAGSGVVVSADWNVPAPNTIDGDDATYETIIGPDVLRVDLGAAFVINHSTLRIGTETAGSRTYTLKGANVADFSDEVTLATYAFTATGSFTAQDVDTSWTATEAYRYYELDGDDETRYVFTWSLFEPTIAGDLSAHIDDATDAHDASAVSYDPTSSGLTATDVQAAIDEVAAVTGGGIYYNVMDYGAVGNNTADDTTAIQDAIDAAVAAGGGTVFFPFHTYKITATLTVTGTITFLGDGGPGDDPQPTVRMATTNTTAFSCNSAYDVSFRYLYVKGPTGNSSGSGIYGNNRNIHTFGCRIDGFYYGLRIGTQAYYSKSVQTLFNDNDNAGVWLEAGANNAEFTSCRMQLSTYGLKADGVHALRIVGGSIEHNTYGVYLPGGNEAVYFSGVYFETNATSDVYAGVTTTDQAVTFEACLFTTTATTRSIDTNLVDRLTVIGCFFDPALHATTDIRTQSASTYVALINNTMSAGGVSLAGPALQLDASDATTPAAVGDAASRGSSRYLAPIGHVHALGGTVGGDLSGTVPNPTVAKINGVAVTGTPAVGYVPTATSSSAATWQAPTSISSTGVTDHEHIENIVFSGDGATTVWELPAAPVDATSIDVYVTGSRSIAWVLSGTLLTTLTFDSAPASAANNIVIDIVAATA